MHSNSPESICQFNDVNELQLAQPTVGYDNTIIGVCTRLQQILGHLSNQQVATLGYPFNKNEYATMNWKKLPVPT